MDSLPPSSDTSLESVPDIDVAEITTIANRLAWREELMLEKQQWRDGEDRIRAYKHMREAKEKWIEAATKTKESIEAAKRDAEQGKAKLEVLSAFASAIHPSHMETMKNTEMRFEYLGEVSDAMQGLLDIVVGGAAEKMAEAISVAKATQAILKELGAARQRAVSQYFRAVYKHAEMGGVHRAVMQEAASVIAPDKWLRSLTFHEASLVQAKIVEMAGRTTTLTKLVSALKDTRTIRIILVSLVILVIDTVDAGLDGGPTAAVLTGIKGVVGSAAGLVTGLIELVTAGLAGANAALLGCVSGAIAGFVVGFAVGLILDAFLDLVCSALTPNEAAAWEKYMLEPIVYRVFIEN
ncbi:hypothetical protein C8F01DRAFT_1262585 [Mycena amicta]|nr:hypothetical protein C8F01DRAFT_1262585 [Mycena amicta]